MSLLNATEIVISNENGLSNRMWEMFKGPPLYCRKFKHGKILSNIRLFLELWKSVTKKGDFFLKSLFKEVILKFQKWNYPKLQKSIFSNTYVVKKTFAWPEFTRFCFPLAYITHDIKREYLTFMKLSNSA